MQDVIELCRLTSSAAIQQMEARAAEAARLMQRASKLAEPASVLARSLGHFSSSVIDSAGMYFYDLACDHCCICVHSRICRQRLAPDSSCRSDAAGDFPSISTRQALGDYNKHRAAKNEFHGPATS